MFGVLRQVTFLFSSFRRLVAARFARGYTIVEMAIALAVLGLLFAGALYPWQNRVESDQRREVESMLDSARLAVVAYAARNRTRAASFRHSNGAIEQTPVGRPYLPCPDITGDGVEDRERINELNDFDRDPFERDDIAGIGSVAAVGACRGHKGMLPWATLGVAENDVWGGRFTYRVDPAFSNALLGFDETTRADVYDFRDPCPTGDRFSRRSGPSGCSDLVSDSRDVPMPALICDAPCNDDSKSENVFIGLVAETDTEVNIPPSRYNDGDIIDGAVFVIVSHGLNSRGAFNRHVAVSCNKFPDPYPPDDTGSRDKGEQINARLPKRFADIIEGNCDDAGSDYRSENDHFFVSHPRTRGGAIESGFDFDDIVIWASANEIIGHMAALGVMPITALPDWPPR